VIVRGVAGDAATNLELDAIGVVCNIGELMGEVTGVATLLTDTNWDVIATAG